MEYEFPYWAWSTSKLPQSALNFEDAAIAAADQHCGRPVVLTFNDEDVSDEENSNPLGQQQQQQQQRQERDEADLDCGERPAKAGRFTQEIKINSYVLVRHSPVFLELFNQKEFLDKKSNVINLPASSYTSMECIITAIGNASVGYKFTDCDADTLVGIIALLVKYRMQVPLARAVSALRENFNKEMQRYAFKYEKNNVQFMSFVAPLLTEIGHFQLEELEQLVLMELRWFFKERVLPHYRISDYGDCFDRANLILLEHCVPRITRKRVMAMCY